MHEFDEYIVKEGNEELKIYNQRTGRIRKPRNAEYDAMSTTIARERTKLKNLKENQNSVELSEEKKQKGNL